MQLRNHKKSVHVKSVRRILPPRCIKEESFIKACDYFISKGNACLFHSAIIKNGTTKTKQKKKKQKGRLGSFFLGSLFSFVRKKPLVLGIFACKARRADLKKEKLKQPKKKKKEWKENIRKRVLVKCTN